MTAAYHMSLSFNNQKEVVLFPVLPEKIQLNKKGRGATHDIIGLGQINVIKARELAEISFESFFPNPYTNAPYLTDPTNRLNPQHYVDKINKFMEAKHPCRFILKGEGALTINLPVSIESFDRWEEAGSPGDIYYKLSLKEYVFHAAKKVEIKKDPKGNQAVKTTKETRPDMRVPQKTYTVQPGDNLTTIARKVYGDSGRAKELQKDNNISDAQLKKLKVGTILKLRAK